MNDQHVFPRPEEYLERPEQGEHSIDRVCICGPTIEEQGDTSYIRHRFMES